MGAAGGGLGGAPGMNMDALLNMFGGLGGAAPANPDGTSLRPLSSMLRERERSERGRLHETYPWHLVWWHCLGPDT